MASTISPTPTNPFAVFRNRNFTLIWSAQLISTIGTALTSLAASIYVFRETGSALSVGLMLMATAAPSLLVGLVAGVFVDRMDRKRILIAADLIRAVLVVIIPFVIHLHIGWLYVIVALTSAVGQFFEPAHSSVLPEIASDEELAAANSFIAISSFGSTALGFAASGLIASRFPIEWAFYLDGFSFLLSAVCIVFVKIPLIEAEGRTTIGVVFQNIRAGARYLFDQPILRSVFSMSILAWLSVGLWNALLLPFSERALGAGEFEYGVQEGLTSVGFVLGSLLMARWAARLTEVQWVSIGYLGMAAFSILYAQATSIPFAIALVMIVGFLNAPVAIARRLIVQRNTTREVRGRVMSTFLVTANVVFLFGMGAAGLADLINVRVLMLGSALLTLAAGLLSLVLPGFGRPAAEWRQALSLLRAARTPAQEVWRAATVSDFDQFARHQPFFATLSAAARAGFIAGGGVTTVNAGETILSHGAPGDEVYFILGGEAIAGVAAESGEPRSLSTMGPGDVFGEIAALMGTERTADVIATQDTTLLRVPAQNVRALMSRPRLRYYFLSKLTERLDRTHIIDLPRLANMDQQALRELRTPAGT